MKFAILCLILFIFSIKISAIENAELHNSLTDSCSISSAISNDCDLLDCSCLMNDFEMQLYKLSGECYYHGFVHEDFKNKDIDYIIKRISSKYQSLGSVVFNGQQINVKDHNDKRNSFVFYFRISEKYILKVKGCIDYHDGLLIDDDEVALEFILKQKHFAMNFMIKDVEKYVHFITPETIRMLEIYDNYGWHLIKENYSHLIPEGKRKN
jgi:hypothetical protein